LSENAKAQKFYSNWQDYTHAKHNSLIGIYTSISTINLSLVTLAPEVFFLEGGLFSAINILILLLIYAGKEKKASGSRVRDSKKSLSCFIKSL